ncbi:MAG: ATP-binding cassette domain-containing protein, partial [Desulfobacterales bacterium]|nr:ATP-binding cassette domain-containing protein [Desulfobacterales bacterium]
MALLEVRDLTKHFGGLAAVDGLDFDVHEGEILALIGPNGAGKSTVFNLITSYLKPTRGTITFLGKNI